jgi:hypothetical protein
LFWCGTLSLDTNISSGANNSFMPWRYEVWKTKPMNKAHICGWTMGWMLLKKLAKFLSGELPAG